MIKEKFITSPFVIFHPKEKKIILDELLKPSKFQDIDGSIYEALWFFLKPKTLAEAKKKGIPLEVIQTCKLYKLILPFGSTEQENTMLWEDRNWIRAAYLLFSQMNLKYIDNLLKEGSQLKWIEKRRQVISDYETQEKYPIRYKPSHVLDNRDFSPLSLEIRNLDLESIKLRRSTREFQEDEIPLEDLKHILFEATNDVRVAKDSQKSGDPFFIFNSFYSWLILYVYIQNVSGLKRGLYFYDVETCNLSLVREDVSDYDVLNCNQHQVWIGGGGFCLFFVVQWERYSWIYRHSRAYINLLIQIGELSEQFLLSSYSLGISGWMTPAVSEQKTNDFLKLEDEGLDAMFFMKFGYKKKK